MVVPTYRGEVSDLRSRIKLEASAKPEWKCSYKIEVIGKFTGIGAVARILLSTGGRESDAPPLAVSRTTALRKRRRDEANDGRNRFPPSTSLRQATVPAAVLPGCATHQQPALRNQIPCLAIRNSGIYPHTPTPETLRTHRAEKTSIRFSGHHRGRSRGRRLRRTL
uniref:Uncharacterized protein n=1 Tax=Arabidopsis halleri TaxID=81970 RepID=K4FR58_ARAHA|nr:hypothetical protein 11M19.27 [Arabidopsis halleri]